MDWHWRLQEENTESLTSLWQLPLVGWLDQSYYAR